jgi:hypothetical protein
MGIEGDRPWRMSDENEGESPPVSNCESLDTGKKKQRGLQFWNSPAFTERTQEYSEAHLECLVNEAAGHIEARRESGSFGSAGEIGNVAQRIRDNNDEIMKGFAAVKDLPPDALVDPRYVALLADQISVLRQRLESVEAKSVEHDAFRQIMVTRLEILSDITGGSTGPPVTRSLFDAIGRYLLVATVGAIFCGGLGGPAIALALGDPVSGKVLEGAISGALGAAAAEVANSLEPSVRRDLSTREAAREFGLRAADANRHDDEPPLGRSNLSIDKQEELRDAMVRLRDHHRKGGPGFAR